MKKTMEEKNWLEWLVTIISGILVFFTLGFLVYQLIYDEQSPPDIEIVLNEISQKDGGYAVAITAKNKGSQTAENVIIEISVEGMDSEEKARITFDYLPGKSSVKGWAIFTEKPQSDKLKTHVLGYELP
jgi:uncharacterized protein (TIGR02588 family)